MAGCYWLEGFLARHQELSVHQAEYVSIHRAIGFNKTKVDKYFSILKSLPFGESGDQLIPPDKIFNVDESAFTVCSIGQLSSAENGKTVTAVCCASVTGVFIPPMLIFPRARLNPSLLNGAATGAIGKAMEGHASHTGSLEVIDKAASNNVQLLIFPSHCTHQFQPLDLSFFRSVITHYSPK